MNHMNNIVPTYNANSDIKLKTSMIRLNLCNYSDVYLYVKATITVPNPAATATPVNNTNEKRKNSNIVLHLLIA